MFPHRIDINFFCYKLSTCKSHTVALQVSFDYASNSSIPGGNNISENCHNTKNVRFNLWWLMKGIQKLSTFNVLDFQLPITTRLGLASITILSTHMKSRRILYSLFPRFLKLCWNSSCFKSASKPGFKSCVRRNNDWIEIKNQLNFSISISSQTKKSCRDSSMVKRGAFKAEP